MQLNRTEVAGVARARDGVTSPVGQQPVAQQGDIIVLAEGNRHHRPDNPGRDPEVGRRPPRGHRAGPPVGHRRIVQPTGFRQYQGGTDVAEQLVTHLSGVGRRVGQHSECTGPVVTDVVAKCRDQAHIGAQRSRVADGAEGVERGPAQLKGRGELTACLGQRRRVNLPSPVVL